MSSPLFIGLDFGTDSVRALVADADGQTVADAVREAMRGLDPARVLGIGVDTTASTPCLVDAGGQPLALSSEFADDPDAMFVLWKDHTAIDEAARINEVAHGGAFEDYTRFIQLLYQMVYPVDDNRKELPKRCLFYAYCLMPNHVHLLIREASESVSLVIKRIGVSYAQHYNKKYQHFGHLFQDRFKSEPVNDHAYFITLLRYIHQNPVAAGISADVASYKWSSWAEYERRENGIPTVCSTQTVLARLPLDDLRALVNEPLPKTAMILDFDSGHVVKTDEEMKDFFADHYRLENPMNLQLYDRKRRNDILRDAKTFGGSIRQLVRLTGISFDIIRDA